MATPSRRGKVSTEEKLWLIQQFPPLTIVSVGSGNGQFEYDVHKTLPDRPLLCVDPDPEVFEPYPANGRFIAPEYPYVAALVEAEPGIVGNCCLVLHWPQHNGIAYDIEAVRELRPKVIFAYYEAIGGAGSIEFHYWLKNCVSGRPLPSQYDYGRRVAEMRESQAQIEPADLPEGYSNINMLLRENKEAAKLRAVHDVPMLATKLAFSAKAYCAALIGKI